MFCERSSRCGHAGRMTLPGVANIVSNGRDARPARPGATGAAVTRDA